MMQGKWSRCLSGVGGAVLIGGLVLANYGGGVAPAEAHDQQKQSYNHPNPFRQILDKLNEVLEKLKNGGGGGAAGNYTMRWDTNSLSSSGSRFTVLTDFGSAAVRDNNTGLVWEQAPSTIATWTDARIQCVEKNVGGTRGWRLPSVVELMSLIDPSLINPLSQIPPIVPGVFTGVQSATYWSATSNADVNPSASAFSAKLLLNFNDGKVSSLAKGNATNVWCVRGPMSESAY